MVRKTRNLLAPASRAASSRFFGTAAKAAADKAAAEAAKAQAIADSTAKYAEEAKAKMVADSTAKYEADHKKGGKPAKKEAPKKDEPKVKAGQGKG